MRFEIEWIAKDGRYLMARQLDPGDFALPARFAGRSVRAFGVPRALDAAGKQRMDLFAIEVDTTDLRVGEVAELTPAFPSGGD